MRFALIALCLLATPATAQVAAPDKIAAQRAAIEKLDFMNGRWRGPAVTQMPGGAHQVTQTERIGNFLDGTLKLIEGHGYNADGTTGFHAFGVVSFDDAKGEYVFSSHAQGHAGTFAFRRTDTGYVWDIPAGPKMTIRYTATITATHWNEVGDRIVEGALPQRFFEMNLTRLGDTNWPAAGGVPMK